MNDLTIIICAYNVGTNSMQDGRSFIRECLATLQPDSNLILVDDGSMDDTYKVIQEYEQKFPEVKILRFVENVGVKSAFNAAADMVDTHFMIRADADILFPTATNWQEQILQHFMFHPECGGLGATQYLPDGRLWCAGDRLLPKYEHIQTPIARNGYRVCHSIMGCFSAYPMYIWEEVRGITSGQWMRGETEDLNLRIQKHGYEIHCLPLQFVHCHSMSRPKSGEYNNTEMVAAHIREHFMETYNIPFYEATDTKLSYIRDIQDR